MRAVLLAGLLCAAGCYFDTSPGPRGFLCERGGCPAGHRCVDGVCVDEATIADASLDDPDAKPADASPGVDADSDAQLSWCQLAELEVDTDNCSVASKNITDAARAAGGVTLYGDTTSYENDLGSPPTTCGLSIMYGRDAFYRLDVTTGDIISATVDAEPAWDTALYLATGCATGSTCPAGQDRTNMTGEAIQHTVLSNATLFLVVDTFSANTTENYGGCYRLQVSITQ